MSNPTEENQQMLQDCFERESKLIDWERGFLDSTQRYMDNHGTITEPQEGVLEKIWDRVTQ